MTTPLESGSVNLVNTEVATPTETERLNLYDAIGRILGPVVMGVDLPLNIAGTPERGIICPNIALRSTGPREDFRGSLCLYRTVPDEEALQQARESLFSSGTSVVRIRFDDGSHNSDLWYRYGYGTTKPDEVGQLPWLSEAPIEDLRTIVELDPGAIIDWDSAGRGENGEHQLAEKWDKSYKAWISSLIAEKMNQARS